MSTTTDELMVYHNPFAGTTEQPRIPDGKATHSIGFSSQTVGEVSGLISNTAQTLDFILYPGMTSCLLITGSQQPGLGASTARNYFVPEFLASNNINHNPNGGASQTAFPSELYAKWRMVSCGVQLKLLNPAETDDGWFEAIRLNRPVSWDDWRLTTEANDPNESTRGTVAPTDIGFDMRDENLVNESSYTTGLLRDLGKIQFQLAPVSEEHDFIDCADSHRLRLLADIVNQHSSFDPNLDRAETDQFLRNYVDWNYDMIYIRCHVRPRPESAPDTPTRIHYNCVMNQEIIYDTKNKLARYHLRTKDVGPGFRNHVRVAKMSHAGSAANVIQPDDAMES